MGWQPAGEKTTFRLRISICVAFVSICAVLSGAESVRGQGLKHEMEVVGHEAEAEELDRIAGFRVGEQVEKGSVVAVFVKDRSATVASIEDMVDITSTLLSTGEARHGVYETPPRGERSKK